VEVKAGGGRRARKKQASIEILDVEGELNIPAKGSAGFAELEKLRRELTVIGADNYGLVVSEREDLKAFEVQQIKDDAPTDIRSQLDPGDLILAVNGYFCVGYPLIDVVVSCFRFQKKPGEKVELLVLKHVIRPGKPLTPNQKRDIVAYSYELLCQSPRGPDNRQLEKAQLEALEAAERARAPDFGGWTPWTVARVAESNRRRASRRQRNPSYAVPAAMHAPSVIDLDQGGGSLAAGATGDDEAQSSGSGGGRAAAAAGPFAGLGADDPHPCLLLLDSAKCHDSRGCFKTLRRFCESVWKHSSAAGSLDIPFDAKTLPAFSPKSIPRQTNDCDCGFFVMQYAETLLKEGLPITKRVVEAKGTGRFSMGWFPQETIRRKRQSVLAQVRELRWRRQREEEEETVALRRRAAAAAVVKKEEGGAGAAEKHAAGGSVVKKEEGGGSEEGEKPGGAKRVKVEEVGSSVIAKIDQAADHSSSTIKKEEEGNGVVKWEDGEGQIPIQTTQAPKKEGRED